MTTKDERINILAMRLGRAEREMDRIKEVYDYENTKEELKKLMREHVDAGGDKKFTVGDFTVRFNVNPGRVTVNWELAEELVDADVLQLIKKFGKPYGVISVR